MAKSTQPNQVDEIKKQLAKYFRNDLDQRFEKLEAIHRDVDFANRYRLEFIKHCMSLAAAVFVFTVAFINDIIPEVSTPQFKWLIAVGWFAMIVSLICGLGHMVGWDRYYISYRDYAGDSKTGKQVRKKINFWRRVAMFLQLCGFSLGLIAIAAFCLINL